MEYHPGAHVRVGVFTRHRVALGRGPLDLRRQTSADYRGEPAMGRILLKKSQVEGRRESVEERRLLRSPLVARVNPLRALCADPSAPDGVPRVRFKRRAFGAQKIGSSRQSDFLNKIDPKQTWHRRSMVILGGAPVGALLCSPPAVGAEHACTV